MPALHLKSTEFVAYLVMEGHVAMPRKMIGLPPPKIKQDLTIVHSSMTNLTVPLATK